MVPKDIETRQEDQPVEFTERELAEMLADGITLERSKPSCVQP